MSDEMKTTASLEQVMHAGNALNDVLLQLRDGGHCNAGQMDRAMAFWENATSEAMAPPWEQLLIEARGMLRRCVKDWGFQAPEVIKEEARIFERWLDDTNPSSDTYLAALRQSQTGMLVQVRHAEEPVADDLPAFIDPAEFRSFGYLHEVNRLILHPLGLALATGRHEDGTETFVGVYDNRDDAEGWVYSEDLLSREKAERVKAEFDKRMPGRMAALGYAFQPVTDMTEPPADVLSILATGAEPAEEEEFVIHCRAQVVSSCMNGEPTRKAFGENLPLTEDGTFKDGTVICDPCYAVVCMRSPSGRGLHSEIDDTIAKIRAAGEGA